MSNVVSLYERRLARRVKVASSATDRAWLQELDQDADRMDRLLEAQQRPLGFYAMGLLDELKAWQRPQDGRVRRVRRWLCKRLYELADWVDR